MVVKLVWHITCRGTIGFEAVVIVGSTIYGLVDVAVNPTLLSG